MKLSDVEISNCCNGFPANPVRPGREQQSVEIFMCRQYPEMELAGFFEFVTGWSNAGARPNS
tara:strand:- start:184 stop:369 length:186 start_codon:yes stop_codon:yes gene_type:complete